MDKVENLKMHISVLDDILTDKKDWNTYAHKEVNKIYNVYKNEIQDLGEIFTFFNGEISTNKDQIEVFKAKLEHYCSTVEEQRYRDKINNPSNSINVSPVFSPSFNSVNDIHATSNSTNTISITIEQLIHNIYDIDNESLSDNDKAILIKHIMEADKAKKNNQKQKLSDKVIDIMNFITTKGIPVWNTMFPYLTEISKFLAAL